MAAGIALSFGLGQAIEAPAYLRADAGPNRVIDASVDLPFEWRNEQALSGGVRPAIEWLVDSRSTPESTGESFRLLGDASPFRMVTVRVSLGGSVVSDAAGVLRIPAASSSPSFLYAGVGDVRVGPNAPYDGPVPVTRVQQGGILGEYGTVDVPQAGTSALFAIGTAPGQGATSFVGSLLLAVVGVAGGPQTLVTPPLRFDTHIKYFLRMDWASGRQDTVLFGPNESSLESTPLTDFIAARSVADINEIEVARAEPQGAIEASQLAGVVVIVLAVAIIAFAARTRHRRRR